MMHDPVMKGVHAAGYPKQRSQEHDCHQMEHFVACSTLIALQGFALLGLQIAVRYLESDV